MTFKSGFITILGRPNVGKSSLLNQLIGSKVSIVSNKAQTTQHNVRGILTIPNEYQLIFVDTPGVHSTTKANTLNRQMNAAALNSLKESDFTIFLAPVDEKIGKNDFHLLHSLEKKAVSFMLVLTKKDLVTEEQLTLKVKEWRSLLDPNIPLLPISINDEKSLGELVKQILNKLPANGARYFDDNLVTDETLKRRIQDLIREAILFKTGQEVPHDTLVIVESIENSRELLKIRAVIIVDHNSQKGIIIGLQGKKIKDIKYRVRKNLKELFPEQKVDLTLFVKVKNNWKNSLSLLKKEKSGKGNL